MRAIAIGSVVGVLGYVPLILASSWEWVLLASALSAVTHALIGPSFDAFIADHSAPENRARLFGITQTLYGVVGVIGPVLGGFLVENLDFKRMLMAAALLYLMATIIRVSMAREASKGMETSRSQLSFSSLKTNLGAMVGLTLAGGLFTWILLTDGVRDIFFSMSFSFLSVYMQDIAGLTITEIGLMSSIFGVAMMAVMIPAGWLADKFGERLNIAISFLLMSISIGMIATVPPSSPPWVYGVLARRGIRLVQHQPGAGLAACTDDRGVPVGEDRPAVPLHAHRPHFPAVDRPGLAQIQGERGCERNTAG